MKIQLTTGILSVVVGLAFGGAAGAVGSATNVAFPNNSKPDINDLEITFSGTCDGINYLGQSNSTPMPNVTGLHSNTVTISGGTLGKPGYLSYNFTSLSSGLEVMSAKMTKNNTDEGPAVVVPQ